MAKAIQVWRIISLALALLLGLTACSGLLVDAPSPTPQGWLPVSLDLRDFYMMLGGDSVLGPAISPAFDQGGDLCQYTTNVEMCYNPNEHAFSGRYFLAPIGAKVNLKPIGPQSPTESTEVYEGFAEIYNNQFFGTLYAGRPLTGVRYNPQNRRLEQYFEKMGFYILADDPQHEVHLMAYGVYVCGDECVPANTPAGAIGSGKGIDVLNPLSLDRIGGYSVFGDPLTGPYIAPDGNLEQVLQKAVVYVPSDNSTTLRLRSLVAPLNLSVSQPGPQKYTIKDGMVFYSVDGELGFHIPIVFDQFIATHGGIEISGKPLTDPFPVTSNGQTIARQCFENYCLEYDPNAAQGHQLSLATLGPEYLTVTHHEDREVFKFSRETVDLQVSELKPQVSDQDAQEIQILLRTSKEGTPISDIDSFVLLALANGQKVSQDLPPTNADGIATVTIPPLVNQPNGAIIPYIVCLNVPADDQICKNESFLIWNVR